ncbi:MAG: MFS transporter [Verrucomicrobiae bacterium]|nr:MFS transporter [Verrucomicrobiae bacterium]MCP5550972.1 MFS transporter [Akkermansiaceae bacterium]
MPARKRLFNRGFVALLFTQFFGAVNDNLLKGVLSFAVAAGGLWANRLGEGGQGYVGLCLTLPFIVLSGLAGQLADRGSKRTITVIVKAAEIGIALIGLWAFVSGNLWLGLTAMLALAIQSAFFGPAKYGMIPELVGDRDLSQANGTINMATNIAVIAGTLAAGPIYTLMDPASAKAPGAVEPLPAAVPSAPGIALLAVAVAGMAASLFLPKLAAMDPGLRFDWNPFRQYWHTLRDMAKGSLLLVAAAWAFFYMIGMIAILVLPDYRELLGVSPTKASYLLGALGVAIGIGSVAAGLISGKHIEPRLIPVGAAGMTVFFALLGTLPLKFGLVMALIAGAGLFAGFYIVPLQALLQHLSPADERGRFLGTANAMSFVASTLGSIIFLVARSRAELPSNRVFLICAGLALIGTGVLVWRLRKLIADPSLRHADDADDAPES